MTRVRALATPGGTGSSSASTGSTTTRSSYRWREPAAHIDAIPAVSVAAYTSKGGRPHGDRISSAAGPLSTSEADMTASGAIRRPPSSWAVASALNAEGYPTNTRGWNAFRREASSSGGMPASSRSVDTNGALELAPTTALWWVGTSVLTTAIRSGRAGPKATCAQRVARA